MSENSGSKSSQGKSGNSPDGKKKRNNRRRRSNNNKRGRSGQSRGPKGRAPKFTGFEKVERGYLNLLEKHLEARKKYYALYHRADPRQLAKLEKTFYRTLEELRDYEENIKPEYQEEFKAKYDGLKPDHTYSENHEIDPKPQEVQLEESQIEDPHYLPSQKNHEFVGDDEESVGSIEDYKQYKGLN